MLRAHPWVVSAATDETLHVMTRRTATLSLAAVLLVVLLALALLRPVPFVTLSPGPTRNTLGSFEGHQIVQISGRWNWDAPSSPVPMGTKSLPS